MKRILAILIGVILVVGSFTGCSQGKKSTNKESNQGADSSKDSITKVLLLVNGNLGDKSFFDSANEGIKLVNEKLASKKVEASVIEMGKEQSKWESTLRRVSEQDYDIIIVGTWQMSEPLQRVAKRFPDKRYIIFDAEVEEDKCADYKNVHSIMFMQNQGGFLAGTLAAMIANGQAGMGTPATKSGKVGFIGGMKIDIINDFAVGFAQGVQHINNLPSSPKKVSSYNSYVGDFFNSPKATELAGTQYSNGVDVIFAAASQAGLGVMDEAKVKNKYVIGVDSDQYEYFKDTDKKKADLIITSVLKRVDLTVLDCVEKFVDGKLEFGVLQELGLKEKIVSLAKNENYERLISKPTRDYIQKLEDGIIDGSIEVKSAIDMPLDEINAMLDSVAP